jgi:hypothetical protein
MNERPWPFEPWNGQWYLADTDVGWFVVSPWGGHCGPFTEEGGAERMRELRAFPVWCPACLEPMVQDNDYEAHKFNALWRCPICGLAVEQEEIADMIRVNE